MNSSPAASGSWNSATRHRDPRPFPRGGVRPAGTVGVTHRQWRSSDAADHRPSRQLRRPFAMTAQRHTEHEASRALRLDRAARGVDALRRAALAAEQEFAVELNAVAPAMRASAYNLVHYLAVRRLDVRELQGELSRLGLSSLGRMEAHVMASLRAVQEALCTLRQQPVPAEIAAS